MSAPLIEVPTRRPSHGPLPGFTALGVRLRKKGGPAGPPAFFGLLTAFFTFPLVFQFRSAVPGMAVEDRLQNLWNFWWVRNALESGNFYPYLTDRLFFPYYQPHFNHSPLPLYFHDLQLFNGLITLPLQLLGGGVTPAYNGIVFGATFISGLATYWLIRRLGGSVYAAGVGGAIYAFAPVRLSAINQSITNIQSTEFLPLYALFLEGTISRNIFPALSSPGKLSGFQKMILPGLNKKMVAGAALTLTLCIYTDWYNTIYLLAYTLFYFVWHLLYRPYSLQRLKLEFSNLVLVGVITFALVSPLLLPSIANLNNPDFKTTLGYEREAKGALSLASLIFPVATGSAWAGCAVGYSGLLLSLIAVFSFFSKTGGKGWLNGKRVRLFWLCLTLVGVIMSLGPRLALNDRIVTDIPLPYSLFRLLPVVSVTRAPYRFIILAMLGVAVLAALAIDWLSSSNLLAKLFERANPTFKPKLVGGLLSALSLALLVGTVWSPLPLFPVKNNPFFESLAREPGDFNLLELPITRHYNHDQVRMFNQIAHGKPILGGYLSRPVVDPYRLPGSPFNGIADLIIRQKRQSRDIFPPTSNQQDLMDLVRLYNFRYIILYLKEFDNPSQLSGTANLVEELYGKHNSEKDMVPDANQEIAFQNEEVVVYRVPEENFQKKPYNVNFTLGEGWYPLESTKFDLWRWAPAASQFYATVFTTQKVRMELKLSAFEGDRTLQIQLNGEKVFEGKVPGGKLIPLNFELTLPEGRNKLSLISLEGDRSPVEIDPTNKDSRRLAFAVHSLEAVCLECQQ